MATNKYDVNMLKGPKIQAVREINLEVRLDRVGARSPLAIVAKSKQVGQATATATATRDISARYHSELAMAAAKKMRRSRQKLKTGQMVCHHLRMMLASEPTLATGESGSDNNLTDVADGTQIQLCL